MMQYETMPRCAALLLAALLPATAQALLLGPSAYRCFDSTLAAGCGAAEDSPFAGLDFSGGYFYLEDVEDGSINTPGLSSTGAFPTGPGGITDSVDEDDGVVDGSGQLGRSMFGSGASGFEFSFDPLVLGELPTHVGIVWTDGAQFNTVTFEAFDALNASLGTIVGPNIGDGNFLSGTAEDRFFGAINAGGISRITIRNSLMTGSGSGIEADHLQYGLARVAAEVPEPGTLALFAIALTAVGFVRGQARS